MEAILSLFLCVFTLNFLCSSVESTSLGFTTNLIHHDSSFSPYYNSSNTYYANLRNSFRRARARSSYIFTPKLASSPPTIQAPLTTEYVMKISIGTPPQEVFVIADIGSDLVWTQCQPCTHCYPQDSPLFNPQNSSTYKTQPCQTSACKALQATGCRNDTCIYQVSYRDQSNSDGDLALESFTFITTSGTLVVVPNVSFGCGYNNDLDENASGVVGLGNSQLSLVNQISDTIDGKFSYCLVPPSANATSKISFGSEAVVSGPGVQTTPFYTQDSYPFYYLNLDSISIGGTNIKYNAQKNTKNVVGNIVIDSGTLVTTLESHFYDQIEDAFKKSIHAQPREREQDFTLCYNKKDVNEDEVPIVTFHFTGADISLGVQNTIAEVDDGVICLFMTNIYDDDDNGYDIGGAVFGNWQQRDYLVGYDLKQKTVSFKKVDSSKQ